MNTQTITLGDVAEQVNVYTLNDDEVNQVGGANSTDFPIMPR
jgi:hypothetical protein